MSGLPHTSGGVSPNGLNWRMRQASSPHEWGCFRNARAAVLQRYVFPTRVGVFLLYAIDLLVSNSLPHTSGGVSLGGYCQFLRALSSPHEWGCFHRRTGWELRCHVFPTRVGVFPATFRRCGRHKSRPARGAWIETVRRVALWSLGVRWLLCSALAILLRRLRLIGRPKRRRGEGAAISNIQGGKRGSSTFNRTTFDIQFSSEDRKDRAYLVCHPDLSTVALAKVGACRGISAVSRRRAVGVGPRWAAALTMTVAWSSRSTHF